MKTPFFMYHDRVRPSEHQLRMAFVYAWGAFCERAVLRRQVFNSRLVEFHCLACGRPIRAPYNTRNVRRLYCPACRPQKPIFKPDAAQLRHLMTFRSLVRQKLTEHASIDAIINDVRNNLINE